MGNCWPCFKVPNPQTTTQQTTVSEVKEDTMELRRLFPSNTCSKGAMTSIDSHINGSKKLSSTTTTTATNKTSTFVNIVGSDNCGSVPAVQNNIRVPKAFYARLPPLGKSNTPNSFNTIDNSKQQKDALDLKLNALFDQYKDPVEDTILADGIERLCDDLQLSPDDFKVLVLAWKLDAEQMCQFTRAEFINGLKSLNVDSISSIQLRLPNVVNELSQNNEMFKDLYRFTFRFGLDITTGQRILPTDMAIVLWKLVFTIREPPLLKKWLLFLDNHRIRGIPRDTWNMFLNFAEIIGNDLGTYDDTEAWPSLFDDFVEYENDQMNQNVIKDDIKDNTNDRD
ncbi:hypothetical protein HCN44_008256 [Aphidius gifuensis]|uniref:Defective in cullin neddylation protein n=1 Tax=Aphidius gifuensis TaxID=684658 RepID=A0A835CMT7_APHGI|nr:DCN1-like protein 3 [Aphidius gifuensis]XP_044016460.1 DCN1-like protein 3 [Aphidius gifuensis]XP_044016461.1 DCN1-like protein 3 [Aphidius gifuensis]KAF7989582.1 hypothetical protein HCN44_008256 [Aphidius gifuensis]